MLYRTHRPTRWDQVVGQEHVVCTLQGALKSGRIGHAYLFAGPRGTGKTTLARIFAKAIMGLAPEDDQAIDLIEIDAASNRGIEDVRQLKETAGTAPAAASYKVFIVDEVHMLSKDAFNALLKLLEEPPAHVVFILATTEAHKILPTVLSRVQRFDFKKLTPQQIVSKLMAIARAEQIQTEPEALLAIANASDGALRDAEVMLTKLVSHGAVTEEVTHQVLGLVPTAWHGQLMSAFIAKNRPAALTFLARLTQNGVDMDQFTKGFLEYMRQIMIAKIDPAILAQAGLALAPAAATEMQHFITGMDGKLLVQMIQVFTRARAEIKTSPIPSLPLELATIELTE